MAVQPPPTVPVVPGSTAIPPAKKSGCAGCGMGCLGCIGVFVVILLLVVGGGWYFFVVQAQAGVPAPAALVVFNAPVDVGHDDSGYRSATPGESLSAGSSVRTGHAGRAAIQFPDGSFIRMSPDTTLTVTSAQLNKNGTLQSAGVAQKIGRTLSNVQHLISGSSFHVGGHSVSAEVRGTQFEVLVRANGTNLIKVFEGSVKVAGATTITLNSGQEVDADASGKLSAPRNVGADPQDPYPLAAQCARAVSSGTSAGTAQTSTGDTIATGQSSEVDYDSPGGLVSVALCYPGSFMGISPNSARIYYSSDLGGTAITWTIDFYAATPNLGVILTELTVRGVSITTQIVSRLPQATGQSGVSIDFIVDRVYSCSGPGGLIMVVEGHR